MIYQHHPKDASPGYRPGDAWAPPPGVGKIVERWGATWRMTRPTWIQGTRPPTTYTPISTQ
jgi:hypothetical protein